LEGHISEIRKTSDAFVHVKYSLITLILRIGLSCWLNMKLMAN